MLKLKELSIDLLLSVRYALIVTTLSVVVLIGSCAAWYGDNPITSVSHVFVSLFNLWVS